MKYILGYPVCEGCKYSTLHTCHKYNKTCLSVALNDVRYELPCLQCLDEEGYEEGILKKEIKTDLKMGYFHLPGLNNLEFFEPLLKMKKVYPEAFIENRQISELYGAFPGAIWNGRTSNFDNFICCSEDIQAYRDYIENLGLSVNLTWNNHLISGTDVYDRYCNEITRIFHNGKHSITVASIELFNYLKEKYPNFTYYQSVIATSNDNEGYIKKDEKFDKILWTRNFNNDWDELLKVPEEERSNIEFLCNDSCTPICNRIGHYNIVNSCLKDRKDEHFYIGSYCTIDHDFMCFNNDRWPITIMPEQIDEYIENGFCHFKLCSRGDLPAIVLVKILPYLVKPEYITDALGWCLYRFKGPMEYSNNRKELCGECNCN